MSFIWIGLLTCDIFVAIYHLSSVNICSCRAKGFVIGGSE